MYVCMYAYVDAVRLAHDLYLLLTFRVTGAKHMLVYCLQYALRITLGIRISRIVFEEYFNGPKLVCEG